MALCACRVGAGWRSPFRLALSPPRRDRAFTRQYDTLRLLSFPDYLRPAAGLYKEQPETSPGRARFRLGVVRARSAPAVETAKTLVMAGDGHSSVSLHDLLTRSQAPESLPLPGPTALAHPAQPLYSLQGREKPKYFASCENPRNLWTTRA